MTFSLLAHEPDSGSLGICSITSSLADGQRCLHYRKGGGVIASQSKTNRRHGELGLKLLNPGLTPAECLRITSEDDANIEYRQILIVNAHGRAATYTGSAAPPDSWHREGEGVVVVGNKRTSPSVLDATVASYRRVHGELAYRLLTGVTAGQQDGGEREAQFSAFLLVVRPDQVECWGAHIDLRIDHATEVSVALTRALAAYREWQGARLQDPSARWTLPVASLKSPL